MNKSIKIVLPFLVISSLYSCNSNIPAIDKVDNVKIIDFKEGPNTTGVLKEGPNTTGSLKLFEKSVLLSNQGGDYNIPITPEKIRSIDIIYLNNIVTINPEDIKLDNKIFSTKSENTEKVIVEYDGTGFFRFKINSQNDKFVFKFNLFDGFSVSLPMIKGESDINAVINKDDDFVSVKAKSLKSNSEEILYLFNSDLKGNDTITLINNNVKEVYKSIDIENNVNFDRKNNSLNNAPSSEKEKSDILSEIKYTSPLLPFSGLWEYKLLKYKLNLNVIDKGNNKFYWSLRINTRLYQGESSYSGDEKILHLSGKFKDQSIKFKVETKESNLITITVDEDESSNLFVLSGLSLNMTRAVK